MVDINASLQKAVKNGFISAPHFPFLPPDFPIAIAVSAIKLPRGCVAPEDAQLRMGAGTGPSREIAGFHALCEAAERYSLQFSLDRPAVVTPFVALNGTADDAKASQLYLGAPNTAVDSKGCAAGATREDAAQRAVFELLEKQDDAVIKSECDEVLHFDLEQVSGLSPWCEYLSQRQRVTKSVCYVYRHGFCVVRVILCDPDGARPTLGSAAGPCVSSSLRKSLEEAVLSWRNMIELERNGVPPSKGDTLLRTYRGLIEASDHYDGPPQSDIPTFSPLNEQPAEMMARLSQKRVRLFDMTDALVGIPVVRVLVDW